MGDPDPDPGVLGALQGIISHGFVMGVDYPDVGVAVQDIRNEPFVPGIMQRIKARADEDTPAHAAYLLVIFPGLRFVGQEIELELTAVDLPVIVHQHGLDTRPGHIAYGMQHTKHLFRSLLFFYLRPYGKVSDKSADSCFHHERDKKPVSGPGIPSAF